jgi:hypothetical protein
MWVGSCALQQFIEGQKSASQERKEQRMTARKLPRSGLVQPLIISTSRGGARLLTLGIQYQIMEK